MADIGGGPPELVEKRLVTELKRLEYAIAAQELELLELDDRKQRVKRNIEALRAEMKEKETSLAAARQGSEELDNE